MEKNKKTGFVFECFEVYERYFVIDNKNKWKDK